MLIRCAQSPHVSRIHLRSRSHDLLLCEVLGYGVHSLRHYSNRTFARFIVHLMSTQNKRLLNRGPFIFYTNFCIYEKLFFFSFSLGFSYERLTLFYPWDLFCRAYKNLKKNKKQKLQ